MAVDLSKINPGDWSGNAVARKAEQSTPLESWKEQEFNTLHAQIMVRGKTAADNLLLMAQDLKRMNEEKLYEAGGFATFESYTEGALGIKKSQAYTYIRALDTLGEDFFQSTGKIGITKLDLLSTLTEEEREEITEKTDIESATVRELREQIKGLRGELKEKENKIAELEWNAEAENLQTDESEISSQLENAKADAEKAKADAERQKAETDKLKAKLEKAEKDKKALEEKLKNQPVKTVENAETVAERDKARAELEKKNAEIAQLNKKLMVAGDTALTEFKIKFNDWQRLGSELLGLLERLNAETKEKSKAAFNAVIAGWQR